MMGSVGSGAVTESRRRSTAQRPFLSLWDVVSPNERRTPKVWAARPSTKEPPSETFVKVTRANKLDLGRV